MTGVEGVFLAAVIGLIVYAVIRYRNKSKGGSGSGGGKSPGGPPKQRL